MNDNKNFFDESVLDFFSHVSMFILLLLVILLSFTYCAFYKDNSFNNDVELGSSVITTTTTIPYEHIKYDFKNKEDELEYYKNYYNTRKHYFR